MTTGWSIDSGRGRRTGRARRAAGSLALAGVFVGFGVAGWAFADPRAFDGAISALAGGALPGAAVAGPGAAPASGLPSAPSLPPPPASPAQSASPAPTASSLPSPSPAASPPSSVAPELALKLDKALATAVRGLLLPGVEATVTFADGSTWTGVAGLADVAAGRAVDPATPFGIGSVTKTFTSALILRYSDRGMLRLDDPLSRWLPDWPNARRITIRMLLNHTSGVPDFFLDTKLLGLLEKDRGRTWTRDDILGIYGRGALFPPGKGWGYSNTGYLLLGIVAEKVGGAPWAALVRRELLDPLGLTSTYVQVVEHPTATPARAYDLVVGAAGPTPRPRTDGSEVMPFTSVVTAAGSAGSIASTSGDLARWARALYADDVLTAAARKAMLTFVTTYSYSIASSYGLGVSRVKFQGRISYGHTGALAGTRAAIRYFPKEGVAIAVLFNRDLFTGDDVVRILARALFPNAPAASPSSQPTPSAPHAP